MKSKPLLTFGQQLRALGAKAAAKLNDHAAKSMQAAVRDQEQNERKARAKVAAKPNLAARDAALHQAHAQVATLSAGPAAKPSAAAAHHPKLGLQSPGLHLSQVSRPVGVNASGPRTQGYAWKAPKSK